MCVPDAATEMVVRKYMIGRGLLPRYLTAIAAIRLFRDVRLQLNEDLTIWCDNKQTIRLVNEEMMRIQTALRHVDIHNCWIRQEVKKGSFEVKYLPINEMLADGLTKALDRGKFGQFVAQLGFIPLPEIETA